MPFVFQKLYGREIPVSALLLGMAFLDERLDPNHFMGTALIGVGLATIDGRPLGILKRMVQAVGDLPRCKNSGIDKAI